MIFFFIADLHALTERIDATVLNDNIKTLIFLYSAFGLSKFIFLQSEIAEHTQLAQFLLSYTNVGELSRMTQFKDKIIRFKNRSVSQPAALLTYPVLMAADILLYDCHQVFVGEDQIQHLELTKNIAKRFNKKYRSNIFTIPEIKTAKLGAKIMDLQNPVKKMSKTATDKNSYIELLDSKKNIFNKIQFAVTDSFNKIQFDINKQPGISNLLVIFASFKNISIEKAVSKCQNDNYQDFKIKVAQAIWNKLKPLQQKYYLLINKKNKIEKILTKNNKRVKTQAYQKIITIKKKIGLFF